MTVQEAAARLREMAHGTVGGDELRGMARDLYGKPGDREVERLLAEARYLRIGRTAVGRTELEPAYLARLRRDHDGPLPLEGIDLAEGPDVVAVEEGGTRWFVVPQGAVMRLNHWLIEKSSLKPEAEQIA